MVVIVTTCLIESAVPTEIFEAYLFAEVGCAPKSTSVVESPTTFNLGTMYFPTLFARGIIGSIVDLAAPIIIRNWGRPILIGQNSLSLHGPVFQVYFLYGYILGMHFVFSSVLLKFCLKILFPNFFGYTFVALITSGRLLGYVDFLSVVEKPVIWTHFWHKDLL